MNYKAMASAGVSVSLRKGRTGSLPSLPRVNTNAVLRKGPRTKLWRANIDAKHGQEPYKCPSGV